MADGNKFTAIVPTFYRPALLKEAVEALQRQTHQDLEIILINNGATPETVEYLHEVSGSDSRIKLVHFSENQFSWNDPMMMNDVCLNRALETACGDYIWHQQDDDLIADDYAEKMVALFRENPDCTTAAGFPVPIEFDGQVRFDGPRVTNFRPRHMPGRDLVLKLVCGNRALFGAPGSIFTIRREALVNGGGFHRHVEHSQLYGIVPFGVTGFDETAYLYWRYHNGQLNRAMSARGLIGTKETFSLLREWDIQGRWQLFGSDDAQKITDHLYGQACSRSSSWFVRLIYSGHFPGAMRILGDTWRHGRFWKPLPRNLTQVQWIFLALRDGGKRLLKTGLKALFNLWPGLAQLSPKLENLRQRAIK